MNVKSSDNYRQAFRTIYGPDWRHQLTLTFDTTKVLPVKGTGILRELAKFRRLQQRGALDQARARYPQLAAADCLQADAELRKRLQLLVLADVPSSEIATLVDANQAAIDAWESIFFDVRDLRQAYAWLDQHVLEAARAQGEGLHAAELKLALLGGAHVGQALAQRQGKLPLDEADRLFARRLRLDAKFEQAISLPIETAKQALAYNKLYIHLELESRRLALAEGRLREQTERRLQRQQEQSAPRTAEEATSKPRRRKRATRGANVMASSAAATSTSATAHAAGVATTLQLQAADQAYRMANSLLAKQTWAPAQVEAAASTNARDTTTTATSPPGADPAPLASGARKTRKPAFARRSPPSDRSTPDNKAPREHRSGKAKPQRPKVPVST